MKNMIPAFLFLVAAVPQLAMAQSAEIPEAVKDATAEMAKDKINEKIDEVTSQVDQNATAQKARDSIVGWIYKAAEYLSFREFYWVAFALMVAGAVSFALQLVLGKLLMLFQFHINLMEILADALGFAISAVGLILTTQAAAQNSSFLESSAMVLSAAAVGAILGFFFYIRGQTQELREVRALRRKKD